MRSKRSGRRPLGLWLLLVVAFMPAPVSAEVTSAGVMDNVLNKYAHIASTWEQIIQARASWLFITLAIISMVFTFGFMALRKADLGEFFVEFVRYILFFGFFWWLLKNGPHFAITIYSSLRQIAGTASNIGEGTLDPSGIVDIGFKIFFDVVDKTSAVTPVDTLCAMGLAILILLLLALIAVNMLLLLISGWIFAYAGQFFLGFGGSRWTSDMAIGYFKSVLNIAAQLFAMVLIVGIGKTLLDEYVKAMGAGIRIKDLSVVLVVAVTMFALVRTIPPQIGSLAGGNTGALGSGFGAGALIGAAAMGAAAISTAGSAIAAGMAGLGGGAQALMAAFSKANAAESAGSGLLSAVSAGGAGSAANDSADVSTGSAGSGSSGLSAAMGNPESGSSGSSGSGSPSDSSYASGPASSSSTKSAGNDAGNGSSSTTGERPSSTEKSAGADLGLAGNARSGGAGAAAGAFAAKVARIAGGTAANLASGAWDVAKKSAANRISETTGGKIAAAIKASQAAGGSDAAIAQFDGNSLSKGSESLDAASEIAAFRDRDTKAS